VNCEDSGSVFCVCTRSVTGRRWKLNMPMGRDIEFERQQGRRSRKQVNKEIQAYWWCGILKCLGKHYLFITNYPFVGWVNKYYKFEATGHIAYNGVRSGIY
jgi:hypothetical protein